MLSIAIRMPSGAMSIPRTHEVKLVTRMALMTGQPFLCMGNGPEFTQDTIMKHAASLIRQMKAWSDFEAWVILFEEDVEMSREHIKT